MTITIEDLALPASADGAEAEDFRAYVEVSNAVEADVVGTRALAMSPAELLPQFRPSAQRERRLLVARREGRIVARGMLTTRPHVAGAACDLVVDVPAPHRRQGIGTALLGRLEDAGAAAGCTVFQATLAHTVSPGGERVASPTGVGDLPAADPGVRFLRRHGYQLEMIDRISMLDLDGDITTRLAEHRADAQARAGRDYRTLSWEGPTPPEFLDGLARLKTGMSTDAPMAGMQVFEDVWDADRLRQRDERHRESGRLMLTTAVEHVPSGDLAGFTELTIAPAGSVTAVQEDTLVMRAHRGHRLGMLLKAVNAGELARTVPHATEVVTWNSEDNRPMLDVNEALGFRAIGYEGAWQKRA
jgi:GNAT superfamily N-acetyltransferase